jgi:myo-inositol-1(or 4)-monophosphatase
LTVRDDLARIHAALDRAADVLAAVGGPARVERKKGGSPVTAADRAVDRALRDALPRDGEGWLSEESADDPARLACRRVWIVDPIDGTQEYVDGVPEWCVSVALAVDGETVAGGILNPAARERIVGAVGSGVERNGTAVRVTGRAELAGAVVLASRTETRRGDWERHRGAPFEFRPTGSVAYKLARVAAGLADATWSQVRKNEWDVAAGVALVRAAGGSVRSLGAEPLAFNRADPRVPGLLASGPGLMEPIVRYLGSAAT